MLLALAGVTGVGKSYFKDKIVEKLGFEKIKIITTREIRNGEKNNEDKIFVTPSELNNLKESNKIAYDFNMLGNIYAYSKDSLFSNKNTVFELHYSTIFNFRNICPNLTSIYILPQNIEMAKEQTKKRHLKPNVEKNRLLEIDEHYNSFMADANLRKQFDYIVYNNYDKESENQIINIVKKLLNKQEFTYDKKLFFTR